MPSTYELLMEMLARPQPTFVRPPHPFFNPKAKLDPTQIDDRRFRLNLHPGLGRYTAYTDINPALLPGAAYLGALAGYRTDPLRRTERYKIPPPLSPNDHRLPRRKK